MAGTTTHTGAVTCANTLAVAGISTLTGNTSCGGTLSVAGNYGAWGRFTSYGTTIPPSATTALTWTTTFMSTNITRTNNTSSFAVTGAGVYKFDCQFATNGSQTGIFLLTLLRSTNSGSSWNGYSSTYCMNSTVAFNYMQHSSLVQANAGEWFEYTISNPIAGTISIDTNRTVQTVCRVG